METLIAAITIMVMIFWDFLMFYKILLSFVVISNKQEIYELSHELPNDLRRRILGK